jgi:DNA-binding winged helix-turn-helix (wHTH) protein
MSVPFRPPVRFGPFEVDTRSGELFREGSRVSLQEQPFQVLAALLERPGEVVAREELSKKLWPEDTFVDFERGLNKAINKLRAALGDDADKPTYIETFFHNGYIKSLKQLVHFYNTRDVYPFDVTSGNCPSGTIEKVTCWPRPEVKNNEDMTIGKLGLSDKEEDQIVAFLQTLTDGFTTPYPDINKFTGVCATGGTAATQGNEVLIKTPPLPPCASAICGVAPLPTMPIP